MAGSRAFLDTNVLVYLVDYGETDKREVAARLWERRAPAGELVLSTQVLNEFFAVTTGRGKRLLTQEVAEQFLLRCCAIEVVPTDPALVLAAVRRVRSDGLAIWDALIVEAALAARCSTLLTEDLQHGRSFEGLRVENPFRA